MVTGQEKNGGGKKLLKFRSCRKQGFFDNIFLTRMNIPACF